MSRAAGRLILNGRLGSKWLINSNMSKCNVAPTTGKGEYNIGSSKDKLQEITEEKELGITINSTLKLTAHCQMAANKESYTL